MFNFKTEFIIGYFFSLMAIARGLFVWDMGMWAKNSFPVASAICLGAGIISFAILAASDGRKTKKL